MREDAVAGRSPDFRVVLHQHAVLEDGDVCRHRDLAALEDGWREGDVVGLPLTGRPAGIRERRMLAVDGAGLAIGVGDVVVAVEHLDFILALQIYAAVTSRLALSLGRIGLAPFEVELNGAEFLFRLDVTLAEGYLEISILDIPLCGTALCRLPLGQIFAVKQNDSVRG